MVEKKIVIIGAGIAGLAAGCYAQMNGYGSEIFELHDLPGGLCTAWERRGYIFDGCIHYLFGSGEGQPYNQLWQELGAVQGRGMINHDEFMRIADSSGKTLIAYSNPDRLKEHLLRLSPQDAALINDLAEGVRAFQGFDMSVMQAAPRAIMTPQQSLLMGQKMTPFLPVLAKWGTQTSNSFARKFKDPFLRTAFPLLFAWEDIPMMAALCLLAYMENKNAGFPQGGSLEFARAIEKRYLELGGVIHYKAQVEKILTKGGKAAGVRLYNDEVHEADIVISAADGRGTIFHMLDGQFTNRKIEKYYNGSLPTYSLIQVSLGVNRDLSAEPHWTTYLLDEPLLIGGEMQSNIGIQHYCFDPTLAPQGKSCLVYLVKSDYDYWQRIYGRKLYDTEQIQVAEILTEYTEKYYPGLGAQVEVADVATPLSYERYTGNWHGSTCGWLLTGKTMPLMLMGMPKTLPRLKNFYMAGQWVEPGGMVPSAAMSGRQAIQLICYADGKPFEAQIA